MCEYCKYTTLVYMVAVLLFLLVFIMLLMLAYTLIQALTPENLFKLAQKYYESALNQTLPH